MIRVAAVGFLVGLLVGASFTAWAASSVVWQLSENVGMLHSDISKVTGAFDMAFNESMAIKPSRLGTAERTKQVPTRTPPHR